MRYENCADSSARDGFPGQATGTSSRYLDLNGLLTKHRVSTYLMRVTGDDWQELGLFSGDLVLVDRALRPRRKDLVIWWEGDSFRISTACLVPPDTPVWGVVTATIHKFREM